MPLRRLGQPLLLVVLCLSTGASEDRLATSKPQPSPQANAAAEIPADRSDETTIQWIAFPEERFQLSGLPWFEANAPQLWRLPRTAAPNLPRRVAAMMRFPAGARIRFNTNSSSLRIRVRTERVFPSRDLPPMGVRGMDVYVDGTYWSSVCIDKPAEQELTFFANAAPERKEVVLYLPTSQEISISALGIDKTAELCKPKKMIKQPPIVFYGSSIAQGKRAGRPAMSYEAILARRLGIDFVNLGFSGSGKAEPVVVDLVKDVPACCYVFDLGKSYGKQPAKIYLKMLQDVHRAHPEVPLVCITPIFSTRELYSTEYAELSRSIRTVVIQAVRTMNHAGANNVHLVDGLELLGPDDADALQEGVHPSDLGFTRIADRLEPIFQKILADALAER